MRVLWMSVRIRFALVEEGVDGVWVACASCLFEVPFVFVELVLE